MGNDVFCQCKPWAVLVGASKHLLTVNSRLMHTARAWVMFEGVVVVDRRYGLAGGSLSPGAGFEVSKPYATPSLLSLLAVPVTMPPCHQASLLC